MCVYIYIYEGEGLYPLIFKRKIDYSLCINSISEMIELATWLCLKGFLLVPL